MSKTITPKHEGAEERSIAAGDMSPRFFTPAEYAHVCETHYVLAEDVEDADCVDGMLGEVIAVVHGVGDEWHDP